MLVLHAASSINGSMHRPDVDSEVPGKLLGSQGVPLDHEGESQGQLHPCLDDVSQVPWDVSAEGATLAEAISTWRGACNLVCMYA